MHTVPGAEISALCDDNDDEIVATGDHWCGREAKRQRTKMTSHGISTPTNTISPNSRTNEDLTTGFSEEFEGDRAGRSTPPPRPDTLLPPTAQSTPPTSVPTIDNNLKVTSDNQTQQSLSQIQTDEVTTSHTLPVSSPHLWRFPKTTIWYADEDHIPIPPKLLSMWTPIRAQLQLDLDTVVTAMVSEQAKAKNRVKRMDSSRKTIYPELRMSGHQHNFFSGMVTVSPCVWILCGSKSCRNKVRRLMRYRLLPEIFMKQAIEIHEMAPRFSAIHAVVPLPQILSDIEQHTRTGPNCLWTEKEDNSPTMLTQEDTQYSMKLDNYNGDYRHGFQAANGTDDYSDSDSESGSELSPSSSRDGKNGPSSTGDETEVSEWDQFLNYGEHVEPDSPAKDEAVETQDMGTILGRRSPKTITKWHCLEDIAGVRLCKERIPVLSKKPLPTRPADYALLKSDLLSTLKNVSSWIPIVEITHYISNDTLEVGHLSLLLGPGEAHDVKLLPGTTTMPFAEEKLVVRKLQLSKPLAEGTSGTWLSRGSSFAGMVVATFPGQPLALMVTAEDIMNDMACSFPIERNEEEPKQLVVCDSSTQAVPETVSEAYTVFASWHRNSVETDQSVHSSHKNPQTPYIQSSRDGLQMIKASPEKPLEGTKQNHEKFTSYFKVWYCL
ncbi:hypothetical protein CPAR01_15306 [Colletotrichum paranaense]|uniref:Uncharacterized protein n=1 Tax=Colletotrichum paranaense TaxID=1914294 RepID=A0ABQ9RYU9_9PEZI|nr:uncharacterized protein CPAR01_15306 [Colletotrichum paranaense]KAK1519813.1 hypothetical protein CPAR01_15306 [Colletotrichum paranaense]